MAFWGALRHFGVRLVLERRGGMPKAGSTGGFGEVVDGLGPRR